MCICIHAHVFENKIDSYRNSFPIIHTHELFTTHFGLIRLDCWISLFDIGNGQTVLAWNVVSVECHSPEIRYTI